MKKIGKWISKNEGLILILVLVVVLRIPSLFEPYWYGDEGIYLALGQGLKKGLVFYRDIHDNKPPLLYFLAAIAGNVFYFRLMLMVCFSITVVLFFKLMQALFPKIPKAWYLSTLLMIVLTTLTEGNIANAEIFIVLPVVGGVLIAYREVNPSTSLGTRRKKKEKKILRWLGVGLLFSIGFLLKVPALFDFMAVMIWLWWFSSKGRSAFGRELLRIFKNKRLWLMLVGFLLPVLISMAYYTWVGAGERYLRSALMQNIGYLASWSTGEHSSSGFATSSGIIIRAGLLFTAVLGFWGISKKFKLSSGVNLMVVLFLFGLFGALLSERPYPHYLIQPIVPLAILISYFLFGKRKIIKLVVLGLVAVAGFYYHQIKFWHYPIIPYYKNYIDYRLGKKNIDEYRNYFDFRVTQTYKVAQLITKTTLESDRLFIWGDEPGIYPLSNRLPIGRYTVAYHVVDFNGFDETILAFDKYKPKVVVLMKYEKRPFPQLKTRLATDYVLTEKIDQALIYRSIK
ncbi:MAG: hypothetical protein ABIJ43_05125 [Candidatus Beckwithbacteria bacterium]|nr:hypothetical protein [Patescibacteria group bacterium]